MDLTAGGKSGEAFSRFLASSLALSEPSLNRLHAISSRAPRLSSSVSSSVSGESCS